MNSVKINDFLINESLGTLMKKYSIPCIVSLLVAALYNIVDQVFIANASYLGSYGNAANTVVFPLTVVALAVSVMIGDGACAFVSINLGKKDLSKAASSIGNAITLTVIASLAITAVYLIFSDQIITLFGGSVNSKTFQYANEYFFWITLGIPFYMLGQCLNPIIRSDGSPKFAMISTVAGAVFNLIFDPVLIFWAKLGMMGAAIATIAGQVLTAVISVCYLFRLKTVQLDKLCFKIDMSVVKEMIPLGITSFLSQASLVVSMAAVQNSCAKYGALDPVFSQPNYTQIPMAVLGIVMKFFQIAISIAVGMAAGCIPVVGYNIGAGRKDRVKDLFTRLLICEAVIGAVALLIAEVFPNQLVQLFGARNESIYYTQFAVKCFRIYLCMLILATVNKGCFIYLQALGQAKESTVISCFREVVLGVILPITLPMVWGLDGLLWSFPLADILTFILAFVIVKKIYIKLT